MKNKKLLLAILGGIVGVAAVTGLVIFLLTNKDDEPKKSDKVKCENITGGSYNLVFNTNGGEKIENMSVCIACPPNSYEELPVAKKDGSVFGGWYYDEKLTDAVTSNSSMDINPVGKKDKNDCVVGYEDITLYAKWDKEAVKTLKVSFDANGGSKVSSMEFKCGSDNTATLNKLPKATKAGYSFVAWYDKHDKAILDGAKIICGSDLKLTAKYDKNEEKKTYRCEEGYTLKGDECTKSYDAIAKCPANSYEVDGKCVQIVVAKKVNADVNCITGTKTFIGYYVCKGERISVDTKSSCEHSGGQWLDSEGACYEKGEKEYSCNNGYLYVSNPGTYVSNIHGESGCYPIVNKAYSCKDSTDKLDGNKCISTIKAELR